MPTWLNIVLALGGSAIISTIIGAISQRFAKESKKIQELKKQDEQKAIRTIMKEELVDLKETSKMNQEGLVACLRRNILAE